MSSPAIRGILCCITRAPTILWHADAPTPTGGMLIAVARLWATLGPFLEPRGCRSSPGCGLTPDEITTQDMMLPYAVSPRPDVQPLSPRGG
mmetsp:Transcript_8723/g.12494  ORF Transcript_8723/g.12494 Transcript_8723/m.12494 type:complete len:91 (-) Transcript_8723:309-581(-)|eukprot:scaffold315326_cov37-Tisochrysis_lutea.AAC.3